MKQKMMKLTEAVLLSGMALLAAGCVKESAINEKYRPAGAPITFSAATGYENGNGTRTEYSGQLYGENPRYERIDWVSEDPITIAYVHGSQSVTSQYAVTEVSGETDRNSTASIEVMTGQAKLTWGEGDGNHTFYAMYPSNGFGDNTTASLTNDNHVQGSIPATQTLHVKDGKYLPPMEFGYMVAYKQISSGSTESRVTLPFTPVVTAFEFKLQRAEGDTGNQKVTGVELEATSPLTGTFAFDITGGDENGATWNTATTGDNATVLTGTGNTITMTFPVEGGIFLPAYGSDSYLDFTLFALPVEQTGVVLKLIYDDDSFKTLTLNDPGDVPHVFVAAKKHVITNKAVPGGLEYVLQHTGTTITLTDGSVVQEVVRNYDSAGPASTGTYDSYYSADGGTMKVAVDVTYEYAEADEDGNMTGSWSSTLPNTLTSVNSSGDENKSFIARVTAYSSAAVSEVWSEFLKHAENLQSRTAVGSSDAPYDLSMYDVHGVSRSNQPVTANCYVVDRAGWYMFPVVYGNAIDYTKSGASGTAGVLYNNGVNAYAYKDAVDPYPMPDVPEYSYEEVTYWHNFQNFTGTSLISTPYVLDDAGSLTSSEVEAVVVWQDVESATYSFIEEVDVVDIPSSGVFYDPKTAAYKTSVPYIKFQVPEGSIDADVSLAPLQRVTGIRPGNALIAVRLKEAKTIDGTSYAAGTILWSWHIWITDGYDTDGDFKGDGLASIPVTNHPDYGGYTLNMMPVNLGWCDSKTITSYKDRVWYVRVSQTSGSAEPIIFRVVQKKPGTLNELPCGTFYQWGRKDPFLPASGHQRNKASYSPAGYEVVPTSPVDPEDPLFYNEVNHSHSPANGASAAIQNPYIYYRSANSWMIMYGNSSAYLLHSPSNLWNMAAGINSTDVAVSKTVYDPCPPGYSVPRMYAFTSFTTTGDYSYIVEEINGEIASINPANSDILLSGSFGVWCFYTNSTKTSTICFPPQGIRHYYTSKAEGLGSEGLYWTAAMRSTSFGYCLSFTDHYMDPLNDFDGWNQGNSIRAVEEESYGYGPAGITAGGQQTTDYNFDGSNGQ